MAAQPQDPLEDVSSCGLASREQEEDGQGAHGGNTDHAPVAVEVGDQLAVPGISGRATTIISRMETMPSKSNTRHHVGGEEGAELVAGSTCRHHGLGELTGTQRNEGVDSRTDDRG